MKPTVAETPIVLYHDRNDNLAKAAVVADFQPQFHGFSAGLRIHDQQFRLIDDGLVFWDYLVIGGLSGDIVGVCLIDFQLNPVLVRSPLVATSTNVKHPHDYGYDILLTTIDSEFDYDVAQAFGHALYTDGTDCLVMLDNWHDRGYCFPLHRDVVFDNG